MHYMGGDQIWFEIGTRMRILVGECHLHHHHHHNHHPHHHHHHHHHNEDEDVGLGVAGCSCGEDEWLQNALSLAELQNVKKNYGENT